MVAARLSPLQTRAQDETFVQQCRFGGLYPQLPLRWPRLPGIPDSPKKRYRSHYACFRHFNNSIDASYPRQHHVVF